MIGYEDQRAHSNEDAQQHMAVWILVVPENLSHLKPLTFPASAANLGATVSRFTFRLEHQ
jgi:hypothetical protein